MQFGGTTAPRPFTAATPVCSPSPTEAVQRRVGQRFVCLIDSFKKQERWEAHGHTSKKCSIQKFKQIFSATETNYLTGSSNLLYRKVHILFHTLFLVLIAQTFKIKCFILFFFCILFYFIFCFILYFCFTVFILVSF